MTSAIEKIAYLGGKEVLADNSVYFEERKDTFINLLPENIPLTMNLLFMRGIILLNLDIT